jgi:hypothetical protein
MNLTSLIEALRESWGEDTAQPSDAIWTPENPANGQCAVSSMLVQEYLGGDLMRGVVLPLAWTQHLREDEFERHGIVHYWNRLAGGVWLDTTRSQFVDYVVYTLPVVRPQEYLYKFEDTVNRYNILKARVEARLFRNG